MQSARANFSFHGDEYLSRELKKIEELAYTFSISYVWGGGGDPVAFIGWSLCNVIFNVISAPVPRLTT